jgi:uncharacterized membrane protein YoaK (UPF0700 family)
MPESSHDQNSATRVVLLIPSLLSAAGGFIDTFAWLAYGHVFTNAQTGNIILIGVSAANGDWTQALRHLPPLVAFFPGIYAAQWLRQRSAPKGEFHAAVAALCVEIAAIVAIALLPHRVPDMLVTFAIAFVAALQSSCFANVGRWSYTSVVTTGNLRTLGKAMFLGVFPNHDPAYKAEARVFAVICSVYAVSAILGGIVTTRFHRSAVVCPLILLSLALLACLDEARAGLLRGQKPGNL